MIQDPTSREKVQPPEAVLLIEPDAGRREPLAAWLAGQGYSCSPAGGVDEALRLHADTSISLVLLNASASPGGESADGPTALDMLRPAIGGSQPMLVYGCPLDSRQRSSWLKRGADDAVDADGPGEELALRIKSLLRVRALRQDLSDTRLKYRNELVREQKAAERIKRRHRRLRAMAFSDSLTGLSNVRFFQQWLATQFEIAVRYKLVMSVLMVDIDNLKRINDNCGHPFGDYVLTQFAEILRGQVRSSDVVARVGGDEFAVGLVETGRQDAVRFGRRLLRAVASNSFECYGRTEAITVSIGQSGFPEDPHATSAEKLVMFADQALYKAKATGRNNLACWHELDPELRLRLAGTKAGDSAAVVFGQPTLCLKQDE